MAQVIRHVVDAKDLVHVDMIANKFDTVSFFIRKYRINSVKRDVIIAC